MARPRGPFDPPPEPPAAWVLPCVTIIAGSMLTLLPVIARFPLLPPFGFMLLLGWRLARGEALPVWAPLPLGLVDDLFSGQPFGFAMLFWTLSFLVIDLLDQRLSTRDFWQDWLLVTGAVSGYLVIGRLLAAPLSAHVDTLVVVQALISTLFYPLIAQITGWANRRRKAAEA